MIADNTDIYPPPPFFTLLEQSVVAVPVSLIHKAQKRYKKVSVFSTFCRTSLWEGYASAIEHAPTERQIPVRL